MAMLHFGPLTATELVQDAWTYYGISGVWFFAMRNRRIVRRVFTVAPGFPARMRILRR